MDIQGISTSQILTVGFFLVGLICIQIFIKKNKNILSLDLNLTFLKEIFTLLV